MEISEKARTVVCMRVLSEVIGRWRCSASYGDDDPSLGVSLSLIPESFRRLRQGVLPVNDGLDFAGLDHLLQNGKVLLRLVTRQRHDLSPPRSEQRSHGDLE